MRKKEVTPKSKQTISTQTTAIEKEMTEEEKRAMKTPMTKREPLKRSQQSPTMEFK